MCPGDEHGIWGLLGEFIMFPGDVHGIWGLLGVYMFPGDAHGVSGLLGELGMRLELFWSVGIGIVSRAETIRKWKANVEMP